MLPRQGEKLGEGHLAADAGGDEDAGQWSIVDGRWSMADVNGLEPTFSSKVEIRDRRR
jgi:hypothetical protein